MKVLEINASTFNVLSDLLGMLARSTLLYSIAYCYCYLMTVHVKSGKTIPVDYLGIIPQSFNDAFHLARLGGISRGLCALAGLILVAEFSHVVSDFNLLFITETLPSGVNESVLDLSLKGRNLNFLYNTVGDPYNGRTIISQETEADGTISDHVLSNSFLAAADSVGRGTSPFLTSGKDGYTSKVVSVHGVNMFSFASKGGYEDPLSQLAEKIPLDCDPSEKMKTIKQVVSVDTSTLGYQDRIEIPVLIPNCDFSQLRNSSVFGSVQNIEVTEFAQYLHLPSSDNFEAPIKLRFSDGGTTADFDISRSGRALARDNKLGWKSGRTVTGITEIVHNNNYAVKLGKVVYANAGPFLGLKTDVSQHEYVFVAEITGECPEGVKSTFSKDCLAFIKTYCDTFPEDTLAFPVEEVIARGVPIADSSRCNLWSVQYVWGVNFGEIDYTLLGAIAGVFARNNVSMRNPYGSILSINAIPAAKFILSTVSLEISKKEEVRPAIGILWIASMVFPVVIAFIIPVLGLAMKSRTLPVPKNSWEVLVVAKEDHSSIIQERENASDSFPKVYPNLKYGILDEASGMTMGFMKSFSDERNDGLRLDVDAPQDLPSASAPAFPVRLDKI